MPPKAGAASFSSSPFVVSSGISPKEKSGGTSFAISSPNPPPILKEVSSFSSSSGGGPNEISTSSFSKDTSGWAGGGGGEGSSFVTTKTSLHLAHRTLVPSSFTFESSILNFVRHFGHWIIIASPFYNICFETT